MISIFFCIITFLTFRRLNFFFFPQILSFSIVPSLSKYKFKYCRKMLINQRIWKASINFKDKIINYFYSQSAFQATTNENFWKIWKRRELKIRLKREVVQLWNRKRKEFILFNHEPSVTFKRYSIHGMWLGLVSRNISRIEEN